MAGLRRGIRIVVTGWVACVIPLLTFMLGYFLLYLPAVNRALWQSASTSAQLMSAAVASHRYAVAAVDAIGVALAALSLAGSLYVVAELVWRLTTAGLRWSAGRSARRLLAAMTGLAVLTGLGGFLDQARPVPWLVGAPATTPPGLALAPPGLAHHRRRNLCPLHLPAMTPAVPAMAAQDLELEHAELLPSTAKFRRTWKRVPRRNGNPLGTHGSFVSRR